MESVVSRISRMCRASDVYGVLVLLAAVGGQNTVRIRHDIGKMFLFANFVFPLFSVLFMPTADMICNVFIFTDDQQC